MNNCIGLEFVKLVNDHAEQSAVMRSSASSTAELTTPVMSHRRKRKSPFQVLMIGLLKFILGVIISVAGFLFMALMVLAF